MVRLIGVCCVMDGSEAPHPHSLMYAVMSEATRPGVCTDDIIINTCIPNLLMSCNATWCQMGTMLPNHLTSLKVPNALVLTNKISNTWKAWIQGYNIYVTPSGVINHTERVECCIFLRVVGQEAPKVHVNITFTTLQKRNG